MTMISLLLSFAFLAIAAHLWRWTFLRKKTAAQTHLWPQIHAKVLESHIVKARPHFDESDILQFQYAFTIRAYTYTGSDLNLFSKENLMDRKAMEQFVAEHPIGSDVQIRYNPSGPQESALNPTDISGYSAYRNLAILCFGFGAIALFFAVS